MRLKVLICGLICLMLMTGTAFAKGGFSGGSSPSRPSSPAPVSRPSTPSAPAPRPVSSPRPAPRPNVRPQNRPLRRPIRRPIRRPMRPGTRVGAHPYGAYPVGVPVAQRCVVKKSGVSHWVTIFLALITLFVGGLIGFFAGRAN